MKVIIIEDELPAISRLKTLLVKYDADIEIVAELHNVIESVNWLEINSDFDLIFMDIRLTDGLSFDIFNHIEIQKPIIFITAYNQYAVDAFKVNSIDYLLKPLKYKDLCRALDKIQTLQNNLPVVDSREYENLGKILRQAKKSFKSRFMVKLGDHIKSVLTENILLFYAEGRTVYLITKKGNKFIIDYTLDELIKQIDPEMFFRANRSVILNINAIKDVVVYSGSRLKVVLNIDFDKEIIVSRERVNLLKEWFEG